MLTFAKVVGRANTGPICSQKEFDLRIFTPNLRRVLKDYDIQYDPENPVPADDALADRVWQAAIDFLSNTGIYVPDTERRILFSQEEIEDALSHKQRGSVFGAGKDAKEVPQRVPEDETLPWCSVGPAGVPLSGEEVLLKVVKAHAENPLADSLTGPCLTHVDGQLIVAGSPTEIEGAIRTMVLTREGLRRAGRPDLPIVNAVASAVTSAGHIAGHRYGIRKGDALEIGTVHEMKVDFDSLNKVALSLAAGSLIYGENGVILGGLAGGPAGTAVITAAYNPVDILILRASVQHPFPTHFDIRTTSTRDTIWARSLANQAITRNSPLPVVNVGYTGAGPMTKMAMYEFAAWVIGSVVSGGSVEIGATTKGVVVDHVGVLEPMFGSEVAHAVAGMTRTEANGIVKSLLELYESRLQDPPNGKPYQEACDPRTGIPNGDYMELYREVRQEMRDRFGLRLKQASPF